MKYIETPYVACISEKRQIIFKLLLMLCIIKRFHHSPIKDKIQILEKSIFFSYRFHVLNVHQHMQNKLVEHYVREFRNSRKIYINAILYHRYTNMLGKLAKQLKFMHNSFIMEKQ